MTPHAPHTESRLSTGVLLGSFLPLAVPVATAALLRPPSDSAFVVLWMTGVVPIMAWSYARGWRGAALATGFVVAAVTLTQVALPPPSGADSGLLAPLLLVLVGVATGTSWIVEGLLRDRGQAEELALTDPLTRLPNRRHAQVFLETVFGAAERGRPVSVVLFDLDHFRKYGERHGRAFGDDALRAFADLLRQSTRRMNLSARIGGEEFLTVLAGADHEGGRAFANRVRDAFARSEFARGGLTVSAGVASYHPSMETPQELVSAADLALFRAKQAGRDQVRVFGRDISLQEIQAPEDDGAAGGEGPQDGAGAVGGFAREGEEIGRSRPSSASLPRPHVRFGAERSVLLVEHEEEARGVVSGYLGGEGFGVEVASDASSAIHALGREFDVVVTDLQLPGLPGTELVKAVKSRWPATQVLVLTDPREASVAAEALNAGADRYLEKPVSLPVLQAQLVDALGRRDRVRAEQRERYELSQAALQRPDEVRRTVVRAALALVRASELRDPYTQGKSRRVASYATALVDALGPQGAELDRDLFHLACLVHDVGMIEVPEPILRKEGPLTPEEFERVRRHPETGRRILQPILGDELVLAVATWHHERWDGSGYPDGLAGEAIPRAARIVAVADALDSMTTPRPYRSSLAWKDATRQVPDRAGTHFDPGLMEAFQIALPRLEELFRSYSGEPEGGAEDEGEGEASSPPPPSAPS